MNKFLIVLAHTYTSRIKTKSFLISTAIMLLFITAFANLETIIGLFESDDEERVIVIDETGELFPALEESLVLAEEDELTLILYEDGEDAGKEAVQADEYEGLLTLAYDGEGMPVVTYYENSATES